MKKLGFVLAHTERSQLAYNLINSINKYVINHCDIAPILFAEEVTRNCIIPSCPVMTMMDLWGFDDVGVATTLSTAQILINTPGPKRKLFYVNDLEWLRMKQHGIMFNDLSTIYGNSKLEIVARADNHAKILENNFGIKVKDVMPEIDLERIYGT